MLQISDAAQLQLISGGPAGGGGPPPGAPGWSDYSFFSPPSFSEVGVENGPPAVVIIGPPEPTTAHRYVDGALIANIGRMTGVAATGFAEGFLIGTGVSAPVAGPAAIVVGLVVGVGAGYAAMQFIEWDHGARVVQR